MSCGGGRRREPGRIRTRGWGEAGRDGAGCGSHTRAGGERGMRDIKFFMTFWSLFKQTIKNKKNIIIHYFNCNHTDMRVKSFLMCTNDIRITFVMRKLDKTA